MYVSQYVCDYAWARPDPKAIKAAGFVAVCRYLSHDRTGKTLTRDEADALHAAGLGVVLNFEDSPWRALSGGGAGASDAQFACALADRLGAPRNIPIYFSCDTDPGNPLKAAVIDYFVGAGNVCARNGRDAGAYGGANLIGYLLSHTLVRYGWTANASSWDHGVAPQGHMKQLYSHPAGTPTIAGVGGDQYDTSIVLRPDFGAWGGTTQGALMALTDAEQKDLLTAATELHHNLMQGTGHSLVNDVLAAVAAIPHPPTATQIAAAVVAKMPAGTTVDVVALAKAIVKAEAAALTAGTA